jgi:hypothetical protein
MNAPATLVISAGHHPANHRSAIPIRAYESGSGHGHDAAPAGHPHPPRPPPGPARRYGPPCPAAPSSALASPRQGRLRRRQGERSAPPDPGRRSHDRGSYQGKGSDRHAPKPATKSGTKRAKPATTRLRTCKHLTDPLHMRRKFGRTRPSSSSTGVLIVEVEVRRPAWWPYPEQCGDGHEWGPGLVLVSWAQCHCAGARRLHSDQAIWGHFTVACREPGCRSVWYDPPHESGPQP